MAILSIRRTQRELPNRAGWWRIRATLACVFDTLGFSSAFPMFEDGVFQADVYIGTIDVFFQKE
jgi:hypothetical protein